MERWKSPTPGAVDPITGDFADMEDRGEKGINYSSEPFKHRLAANPDKSLIFSSVIHGDPSTPMPEAYIGDPIRLRVMQTADRSRGSVFTLHSHRWRYQWTDPNSKAGIQSRLPYSWKYLGYYPCTK